MPSTSDFLNESDFEKHDPFKFETPGDKIAGRIVEEPRLVEVPELDGSRGIRLVLAVNDGNKTWTVWVKKGRIAQAVAQAVKAAGATEIAKDGGIGIKYIGDGERTKPGFHPPKLYRAQYEPPKGGVNVDEFDEEEPF